MIAMPHWPRVMGYKPIDLGLERVLTALERLDHPERKLPPVVHIAGTNGKGSTLAFLRAILEQAGQTVHRYTSPHLVAFNERILLSGQVINDSTLYDVLERCRVATEGIALTFFEGTTLGALLAFAEHPANIVLLETGMGGRLDATNVVDQPASVVLTPISLDHSEYLGDTLAAIAGEKAAIMKPGIPCVVAQQEPEVLAVIMAQAEAVGCSVLYQGQDWDIRWQGNALYYRDAQGELELPLPNLPGAHQVGNAGLAIATARILKNVSVHDGHIKEGLRHAEWPARLQSLPALPSGVELWLDGGHNPAAGQALADFIWKRYGSGHVALITGMMRRKDAEGFFSPLAEVVQRVITIPVPGEEDACPPELLAEYAQKAGLAAEPALNKDAAITLLMQHTPAPKAIVICGSLYLAGYVLKEQK
ncbi:MAG: bifunctional folylpolyglutamate synthase/dihydrofolate synthase [Hyphomicrobiales bacterium]|nr:bifunctional folylpolyglutamate synthase/dihydrofolate synthase [Hyphomicrobiales bacterium]